MRIIKISFVAILLITGPVIMDSCCLGGGSCGCGDGGPNAGQPHFDIDDMSLSVIPFPLGSSSPVPSPATLSAIALQVKLDVNYISARLGGTFGSALFACSPPPSISNHLITEMTITSNNILETSAGNTPAGSDLSFIFEVYSPSYWEAPLDALIEEQYLDEHISLRSETVLSKLQTHTFTVTITLDDARVFTLTSSPLELN